MTQYFEMMGHRAIYHDGWRAVCPWPGASFKESGRGFGVPITETMLEDLDATGWELYDLRDDYAETKNLASREPKRLGSMIARWYTEAGRYQVLPIDSRGVQRVADQRPEMTTPRSRYVLYPGTQSIPAGAAPKILNRPFSINAEVDIPEGGADGVLLSMGGTDGGIVFYVQNGILTFLHNYVAMKLSYVRSTSVVPTGRHFLSVQFEPTGARDLAHGKGPPGVAKLFVDGKEVGRGEIPVTSPVRLGQGAAMLVGADTGATVSPNYQAPFRYQGRIRRVIVDLSGEHVEDYESQMRIALARE